MAYIPVKKPVKPPKAATTKPIAPVKNPKPPKVAGSKPIAPVKNPVSKPTKPVAKPIAPKPPKKPVKNPPKLPPMDTGNGGINGFLASFKKDLARTNRFEVFIPIPYLLLPYYGGGAKNLSMRCEQAELPSRALATLDRKIGSVPIQKFPYLSTYNDITLTFLVDGDMSEKLFFDAWLEVINPTSNFNFKYKKDYSTQIVIRQYDLSNKLTYDVLLIDAFPIAVNQLDLDWSNDGVHKLSVVFAYTYWTNNTLNNLGKNVLTQGLSGLDNFLNNLNF